MIPYTWYVIFGYFTIIFSIFFILAGEQTDIFHLSLDRADELEEMKTKLEVKVLQRTAELDKQKEELKVQAEVLQETNDLLREKNDELNNKHSEIEIKNIEISRKNQILTSQQNNIISSLQYASRIQTAVLPHQDFVDNLIPENFIFFRPKDIVSGDFYFVKKVNQYILLAVADCTGHGVPGAFMSMLGMTILNEIVIKTEIKTSGQVLNELRNQIKFALGQTGKLGEQQDGLDIAFVAIDIDKNILQFSGANLPILIFKNDKTIYELKGDKMPIGIHPKDYNYFTDHELPISKNDIIYLFTDGYHSQLGSETNETLKIKRFRDFLYEINNLPLDIQKAKIIENFMSWKGRNDQTDDVLVFGIKY
jgi:serine phosphatase RsbU (regulator of sigma subunit)